ncbi:hypothetical protein DNTS_012145 [Danionella cerebrum]|uniref:Uncharacterized protein n=1 Tax=Danionella cerebrum TaxID=2873325 RepID=A0A553Q8W3_9TELE|nr:hypothetical protein DNTS_012145 [Danionella translucida]
MISKFLRNCSSLVLLFPLLQLFGLDMLNAALSGPESDTCSTLVQSQDFGFFLSSSVFPSMPCTWTLQNPDPRKYTIFIKVTKPTRDCISRQHRTFQFDSFLETTRTFLGMESFDDVLKLCDASTHVAFLEAGKKFLQMRKTLPRPGSDSRNGEGEFKVEYLVVGNRNPSIASCQMLCQWLEDCLAYSSSNRPCGIMQTPCQCWKKTLLDKEPSGCYRDGVYLDNCVPVVKAGKPDTDTTVQSSDRLWAGFERQNGREQSEKKCGDNFKGGWSGWGNWAECNIECGGGVQIRNRSCQSPPEDSFLCEGVLEEGRPCNTQPCIGYRQYSSKGKGLSPVKYKGNQEPMLGKGRLGTRSQSLRSLDSRKRVDSDKTRSGQTSSQTVDSPSGEEWSAWTVCSATCGEGWQSRTRFCVSLSYSTQCSGPLREQRPCNNTAVCPAALITEHGAWGEWTPWSLCSSTCGRGYRERNRSCKPPQFGGDPCDGPEKQTKFCNIAVCPVDGVWNEWSSWGSCSSTCSNGTMHRKRECNGPSYGGSECLGVFQESRDCFLRECPVDGQWQLWSSWSSCTKTCGGGSQQRQRLCYGPLFGGEPCPGDREEVRSCNEKRCPEPHEICDEENFANVVWKKTISGDTAAVRCPPNAVGLILRRCSLDDEGIAFWENPTYMKCISNDYRSIQTLTRDHLSKAQRGLVGDGVSEVISKLRVTSSDGTSYSGDLLAIIDVLKNMTEIFRRSYYSPSNADMKNFVQSVSNLLMEENRDRWEEAQLLGPNVKELFRLVEDFVDVISLRMKDFQDTYEVTDNLVLSIHKRPVAGNADITFPMKGWRGMVDWARSSEDKVKVAKNILLTGKPAKTTPLDLEYPMPLAPHHHKLEMLLRGTQLWPISFVGLLLQMLVFLPPSHTVSLSHASQRNQTVLNSKVISVTIKPTPISLSGPLEMEFSHLYNGTTNQTCISWDENDSFDFHFD